MNKQDYLLALEKALVSAGVRGHADIIGEYGEHFDMKVSDGYGEEEIAARLASPAEIAEHYREADLSKGGVKFVVDPIRILKIVGVMLADFVAGAFLIIMYAWVATLGVFSLVSAASGVLIVSGNIPERFSWVIPELPFICAVFIGVACLVLGFASAVGTEYCRLYVTQMLRAFLRWHKNVMGTSGVKLPPLPLHPWVEPRKRRVLRSIALFSIAIFFIAIVAALASMFFIARSFEPWHVWGWFE